MKDESILTSVKKIVGLTDEYEAFDDQIVNDINAIFLILYQRGVRSDSLFTITGKNEKWSDFLNDDRVETIKTYVGYKVRFMFDPPTSSILADALKSVIEELEFRLYIEFDTSPN